MDDVTAQSALQDLSQYLYEYYGKKVIVLLDEYDTPMQEAYLHGYWDSFTSFIRGLFNSTFKTNPYLERAVMTGITRVSKESIFSDLNNLNVVTTTSNEYAECFGFTEPEVFEALEAFELAGQKEKVKKWYDLRSESTEIFITRGPSLAFWTKNRFVPTGHRQVRMA